MKTITWDGENRIHIMYNVQISSFIILQLHSEILGLGFFNLLIFSNQTYLSYFIGQCTSDKSLYSDLGTEDTHTPGVGGSNVSITVCTSELSLLPKYAQISNTPSYVSTVQSSDVLRAAADGSVLSVCSRLFTSL